jgi:hypothetical protein
VVDYPQKKSTLQSKTLHHDLLNRVEKRVLVAGLVTDLAGAVQPKDASPETIRSAIGTRPYLHAEGNSVLEDYRRILAIAEKFNEIIGFIMKATQETAKESLAYAELLKPQLSPVDDWLVAGMRLFINTFMPSRINFRIYPFSSCPSFQVLCNLQRDCFLDSDLEHLLYGYGNRPNVPLAVFGLITSLPPKEQPAFNPMKEFEDDPELGKSAAFEQGFRGMFSGMEGMEAIVRSPDIRMSRFTQSWCIGRSRIAQPNPRLQPATVGAVMSRRG